MKIVYDKISLSELKKLAEETFGVFVKATVDVEKEIMVVGGELHCDQESLLLSQGSSQKNIWGINLYPEKYPSEDWVEFDSMINLRPSFGNKTRGIDDPEVKEKILKIIKKLVIP